MVLLGLALAHEPSQAQPKLATQASFDSLKSLAGAWTGTVTTNPHNPDIEGPIQLAMRVASRGSLLIHEMTPGGMPEPTTIYVEDDHLTLVHYCEAGNRPRLVTRGPADPKKIEFDFADISGSKEPTYISHLTFTMIDPGHHTEDWTFQMPDSNVLRAHFDLKRAKKN
jgi:hypothetical protein